MASKPDLTEVGTTGLRRTSGTIWEEFLVNLRGLKGTRVYREMADNDPTIGGMLFAVEKIITRLDWRVDPFKDDSSDGEPVEKDKETAVFVNECLHDMDESWEQTLAGFLAMLVFGYSYHELVYKRRGGPDNADRKQRSQYDDNKIGWRKMPVRSQETLFRWDYDEDGNLEAMVQIDPSNGGMHTIPIEKALLFRTTVHKDNPEGRSILRNVYRPWFYGRRLEEIEAIGVERDLAGLPMAFVPPEMLSSDASDSDKAVLAQIQEMVTKVKRNEQEGLVFPSAYDENGHLMYDFKLLSAGGSRQFNTNEIILRYDQRKTMALLSDFLLIGHNQTGSHALGISKMELWTMAIDAIAKNIVTTINQHAIPKLLKLNGMDTSRMPKVAYGEVSHVDLTEMSDFVAKLVQAGVIVPDAKLESHLREAGGLPPADHDGKAYGMPPAPAQDGMPPAPTPAKATVKIPDTKKKVEPTDPKKQGNPEATQG